MFPGGPGKEDLPLERCMRFLPHHQVRSRKIARQASVQAVVQRFAVRAGHAGHATPPPDEELRG